VQVPFALSISYSNDKEGENKVLSVTVDGRMVSSFQNRDSSDSIDGWDEFVTDPAGTTTLGPGSHTLRLEVSVAMMDAKEIDVATLNPLLSPT